MHFALPPIKMEFPRHGENDIKLLHLQGIFVCYKSVAKFPIHEFSLSRSILSRRDACKHGYQYLPLQKKLSKNYSRKKNFHIFHWHSDGNILYYLTKENFHFKNGNIFNYFVFILKKFTNVKNQHGILNKTENKYSHCQEIEYF